MNQFVAFSGGKDSTALALLMPAAVPVFTDTRWEFPQVYRHIAEFERVTGRDVLRIQHPDWPGGIPEYIEHSAFLPGHGARWCTRMFKIETYNAYIKTHLPAELFIGLRADEPEREGNLTLMEGLTIRYPLREQGLGLADVLHICLDNGLLPRREVYMARGGCMGCFYKRKSEVQAMAALCPDILDELQRLEESVQDERGKFAYMFPNTGHSIRQLRAQPYLIDPEIVYQSAADTSQMGDACGLFCNR